MLEACQNNDHDQGNLLRVLSTGRSVVQRTQARNMCKIFSLVPSKNLSPEKTEIAKCFQFLSDKIYSYIKKSHFTTWQFGKVGVLVNFITQKLKSKHLAISVFSGQRFF